MTEADTYFTTRLAPDPRRAHLWRHLAAYLHRFIPPKARILELGAGYCYFINAVRGRRRVAVDIAAEVVQHAASGVEAIQGDALQFLASAPAEAFDFILASNFLEHFDWPALDDMARLIRGSLAPGGRLALIQPNFRLAPGRYFDDYTHRTIFTDVSLTDWLQTRGFAVVKVVPRFLPFTVASRMGHLSALVPLYLRSPWRPFAGQMFVLAERPASSRSH